MCCESVSGVRVVCVLRVWMVLCCGMLCARRRVILYVVRCIVCCLWHYLNDTFIRRRIVSETEAKARREDLQSGMESPSESGGVANREAKEYRDVGFPYPMRSYLGFHLLSENL